MTRILGISAYYHDSAACLVEDGVIVAAAQEERFTRKKHDASFPSQAVDYCLREAGITPANSISSGFTRNRSSSSIACSRRMSRARPAGSGRTSWPCRSGLTDKLWMGDEIRAHLEGFKGEMLFGEHHESHAASAFYPSPFEQAAIVTIDGVGEWATSAIGVGRGSGHRADSANFGFRIHSACSIRRSPTSPASRSIRANTR